MDAIDCATQSPFAFCSITGGHAQRGREIPGRLSQAGFRIGIVHLAPTHHDGVIQDVAGPSLDALEEGKLFAGIECGRDEARLALMGNEIDDGRGPSFGEEMNSPVHRGKSRALHHG